MRQSGILMHITSLPGPYGVGTMGKSAYDFVDFLEKAGQSCWQILPLSPTGYGDSPYQSFSAGAGNPYLIDLDTLVSQGLLMAEEPAAVDWGDDPGRVSYGKLYAQRGKLLHTAFDRFTPDEDYEAFLAESAQWLPDYALFMALKEKHGGAPWLSWEEDLRLRREDALEKARQENREEIRYQCFVQYQFRKQWRALRAYANGKGIRIIGDVPIYVPLDSADVWVNSELFQLDETRHPEVVAGCPPDGFTADGQLWGNPIYDWQAMADTGYGWWIHRLAAAAHMYDVVRFDHFRGFESYWAVPYGAPNARGGHWVKGPGMDFIRTLHRELPELSIIAEDLGYLTEEVLALRDDSGYPGMKVLQFAFDSREPSDYLPHTYIRNTVCYTGTHDNMTTRQWLETGTAEMRDYAGAYMHLTEEEGMVRGMIRTAMSSVSDLCVVPMQDYLDLGASARMNFPGTLSDSNWTWRAKDGMIKTELADEIYTLTALYDRLGSQKQEPAAASR